MLIIRDDVQIVLKKFEEFSFLRETMIVQIMLPELS